MDHPPEERQARVEALQRAVTAAIDNRSVAPKLSIRPGNPPTFSGVRKNQDLVDAFINAMNAQFLFETRLTENQKIALAATYFEAEKPAEQWMRPYTRYLHGEQGAPAWLETWQDFAKELKRRFGDPLDEETTFRKLHALRQTGSARDYAVRFTELAERTKESEAFKILHFKQFLKINVKTALAGRKFTTLNDIIDAAISIDEDLYDSRAATDVRRPPEPVRAFRAVPPAPSVPYRSQVVPMEIDATRVEGRGPLSPQERQRRAENNLCYRCGGSGHRARFCPLTNARPNNVARMAGTNEADFSEASAASEEQ